MSMSVSPTSASEALKRPDAIDRLWQLSRRARDGERIETELTRLRLDGLSELERLVGACVRTHLHALSRLRAGRCRDAQRYSSRCEGGWAQVIDAIEATPPQLTPHSLAYHMRTASRHMDKLQRLAQRGLLDLVQASRLKSRFLHATILQRAGRSEDALALAHEVASTWQTDFPVRLPGLPHILRTVAGWANADRELSQRLLADAGRLTGRMAPYPEDSEEVWIKPRRAEAIVRFGFAATVIEIADVT